MKAGMTASSTSPATGVGLQTPAGAVSVVLAGPERREQAVQLVLAVQAVTGLPDPTMWPAELLAPHTRDRHRRALGVWVALINNKVVGHALITTVAPGHLEWVRTGDEAYAAAFAAGTLVELGGLAVDPAHTRQGIADLLVRARLSWLETHPELVAVASIWRASPGSTRLAQKYGRQVGTGITGPLDLYAYNR